MPYNFSHVGDLEKFISDNIKDYIEQKKKYTYKNYLEYYIDQGETKEQAQTQAAEIPTGTLIEVYLSTRFKNQLGQKRFRKKIDKSLDKINKTSEKDIKNELKKIAISLVLNNKDVEHYFYSRAIKKIEIEWSDKNSQYRKDCLKRLLAYQNYLSEQLTNSESVVVTNALRKSYPENLEILFKGGFQRFLCDVDTGVNQGTKRSNEGDAAQFLFVSRAILAGFSCSNVDVRTSPYDAVIDYDTYLLRVQIKGINHDAISFLTSPRGGAGADTSAPTNKSKDITREDCDLYVAVEKSNAVCYIIPIEDIENYLSRGIKRLPEVDKDKYKEKWNLVETEAKKRFKIK